MEDKHRYEIDEVTREKMFADHEYDGIRELDNDLPGWWRYLFYICILFAIGYFLRYHVFKTAPLMYGEYQAEFAVEEEGVSDEPDFASLAPLNDSESLAKGEEIFQKSCATCHLAEGQGLVGPNLTDEFWIHGCSFEDILNVVNDGVLEKGMIAWKTQMPQNQIRQVSSFILTLQGTNPPNPKEPQGERCVR